MTDQEKRLKKKNTKLGMKSETSPQIVQIMKGKETIV